MPRGRNGIVLDEIERQVLAYYRDHVVGNYEKMKARHGLTMRTETLCRAIVGKAPMDPITTIRPLRDLFEEITTQDPSLLTRAYQHRKQQEEAERRRDERFRSSIKDTGKYSARSYLIDRIMETKNRAQAEKLVDIILRTPATKLFPNVRSNPHLDR